MTGVGEGKHDYFLAGIITGLIFLTVLVFLNIWPPFHKVVSRTHLRGYRRVRPRLRWGKERHLPQGQNLRGTPKKISVIKMLFLKINWSRVHLQCCVNFCCTAKWLKLGFSESSAGKESTSNAGDPGSIPMLGSFPREGIGCPLQYPWASLVAQMPAV